jgi:transcriptional regulator
MWVPPHFAAASRAWEAELIDRHPFGLLITTSDPAPVATHIPMLVHPDDREAATSDLRGCRVLGHLARANDQWRSVPDGASALLIFQGPHGYVSPSVYDDDPAAPTWNYLAVHVTGRLRWIHPKPDALSVIDATIAVVERDREPAWDPAPSRAYHERIVGGVVAFELIVDDTTSTFKLSQDQPEQRRQDVLAATRALPGAEAQELAEWVGRANPTT